MKTATDSSQRPYGALNPWPCSRCGNAVRITRSAGRLPRHVLMALGAAAALAALTWMHRHGGGATDAALAAAALLLLAPLGLLRARRHAWYCSRCRLRMPPRCQPAGALGAVVVVPTYNNVGTVEDVLRRIAEAAPELQVLVVNDGSTDGTHERAAQLFASGALKGELLSHSRNLGKGAAILTGLRAAFERGFSHAITIDADGQHFPEDIPRLRQAAQARPAAIVVGARDLSADTVQPVSRFGRRFSNFWLRVQTGVALADSQSGMRMYPTAPVLSLAARGRAYDFEVEVLTAGARAGLPLVSVPIRVHYPPADERVSHFDKWWDNVRISWVNTRLLAALPLWPFGWPARFDLGPPPSPRLRAWSGQSRGGAFGHLVFLALLKLVGRAPAYLLLYPVTLYFMFAARPATRASRAFLTRVMGPARNRGIAFWRSYRHLLTFSRCILDRAICVVRGQNSFTWDAHGYEHITSAKGAILLSAHLGNYEVGGSLLHRAGVPVNVVMLDAEAAAIKAVYRRFGSNASSPKVIPIDGSELPALKVLAALRDGELVALHGDRIVDDNWVWCDFLGHKAPFPTGVFMLAAAARVPIILTFGFKESTTHYNFLAEAPRTITLPKEGRAEALVAHAQWYASRVEHYARTYPQQWFNFYDFFAAPPSRATWPEGIGSKGTLAAS